MRYPSYLALLALLLAACSDDPDHDPQPSTGGDASLDTQAFDLGEDAGADAQPDSAQQDVSTPDASNPDANAPECAAAAPARIVTPMPTEMGVNWDGSALTIDAAACAPGRHFASLPFGSAWVLVHASNDICQVWLGGETENPMYDGSAAKYCELPRVPMCTLVAMAGDGGPATTDHPACTDVAPITASDCTATQAFRDNACFACAPNDACLDIRAACLETCTTNFESCDGGGTCLDGVCIPALCG